MGGNRTIKTDVRVIVATNKDLRREVNEGRFRADLFYRLNVFPIHVPALRERVNDIPVLVDYFAARLAARTGKKIRQIEKRSLQIMKQYSWPGNIRELENMMKRYVVLQDEQHRDVLRWNFENGWICKYEGPAMNATSNDVALETVEICVEQVTLA